MHDDIEHKSEFEIIAETAHAVCKQGQDAGYHCAFVMLEVGSAINGYQDVLVTIWAGSPLCAKAAVINALETGEFDGEPDEITGGPGEEHA